MIYLFFLLSLIIYSIGFYYKFNISYLTIDAIVYTLTNSLNGADYTVYLKMFKYILISLLIFIVVIFVCKKTQFINNFIENNKKIIFMFSLLFFISSILFDLIELDFFNYILRINQKSDFYSVNYKEVFLDDISGEETNNLIYIYLESMDTYYIKEDKDCLKELVALANNNINFSNNNDIGGAYTIFGSNFTMGSMYAQSVGLPIYNYVDNDTKTFNSNVVTIGDILNDKGYIQEFMVGSDSSFANTDSFFKNHGSYGIYDLNNYDSENEERNEWGLPDYLLFEQARIELTNLAEKAESTNKKFNFTLATIDCHFPNGYPCSKCLNEYDDSFKNIYACQSRNVYEFVEWVEEQDFFKNTTIVISGDHLNYDSSRLFQSDCATYNCIINSRVNINNTKNRDFAVIDLFPTTLAAMGFNLKNERLGLGTNLFSDKPTIFEIYGKEFVNDEICKLWEG